jgi:hypothetical protein
MPEPVLPPNPDVITGNECVIVINGKNAGYGKSLDLRVNNNVRPIQRLGSRKPVGLKSLNWQATLSMEFHILESPDQGVIQFPTSDDKRADDLYEIIIKHSKSGKRIGKAIGAVNTEGFSVTNNDFSGRNVEFELLNWTPAEGFN